MILKMDNYADDYESFLPRYKTIVEVTGVKRDNPQFHKCVKWSPIHPRMGGPYTYCKLGKTSHVELMSFFNERLV